QCGQKRDRESIYAVGRRSATPALALAATVGAGGGGRQPHYFGGWHCPALLFQPQHGPQFGVSGRPCPVIVGWKLWCRAKVCATDGRPSQCRSACIRGSLLW